MSKVSFDYDDTLSLGYVQMYAKRLVSQGHEVWVVTSRQSNFLDYIEDSWNDDLYADCEDIGIPKRQIHFCNLSPKFEFFKGRDFVWHLDDLIDETKEINAFSNTIGINHFFMHDWQQKCDKLLSPKKLSFPS